MTNQLTCAICKKEFEALATPNVCSDCLENKKFKLISHKEGCDGIHEGERFVKLLDPKTSEKYVIEICGNIKEAMKLIEGIDRKNRATIKENNDKNI